MLYCVAELSKAEIARLILGVQLREQSNAGAGAKHGKLQ
jgi:hypothetical protein